MRLLDASGPAAGGLRAGEPASLEMTVRAAAPLSDFVFGFRISTVAGVMVFGTNTALEGLRPERFEGEGRVTLAIPALDLAAGVYSVDAAVHAKNGAPYDARADVAAIRGEPPTARAPASGDRARRWEFSGGIRWGRSRAARAAPRSRVRALASLLAAGFLAALAVRALAPRRVSRQLRHRVLRASSPRSPGRAATSYRDTDRYNYSPLWAGRLRRGGEPRPAGCGIAADPGLRELLLLLADVATALLVFRPGPPTASARHPPRGSRLCFFFANPVSILVSSRHLQFDGLAILFLLAAIACSERARDLPAAAALSVSLLVKHVTGLHPAALPAPRRAGEGRGSARRCPYAASSRPRFCLTRRSWREILAATSFSTGASPATTASRSSCSCREFRSGRRCRSSSRRSPSRSRSCARVELARASLRLFLVILVFAPGFGRQYCVWPIALGALFSGAGVLPLQRRRGSVSRRGDLSRDRGRGDCLLPGWYGPFWAAVAWLAWELREGRRRRPGRGVG